MLEEFNDNIPHILFFGNIENFNIKQHIKHFNNDSTYILELYCVLNKGIKTIRDSISSFVKFQNPTHIKFKAVILYDAEYMTIDAQYSLRRTIEVYSKNTRFFIITKNKDKLLLPIQSRFIHHYIPFYKESKVVKCTLKDDFTLDSLYNSGIYGDQFFKLIRNKVTPESYVELSMIYPKICKVLKNEKCILFYLIIFLRKNKKILI
jgi:hypothetical protein